MRRQKNVGNTKDNTEIQSQVVKFSEISVFPCADPGIFVRGGGGGPGQSDKKQEDLKVLRRSPDLLNNVKIGQGQLQLIMEQFSFTIYGGCSHFGQVT